MLNSIWPIFISISFITAIFTGNVDKISSSITSSASNAITLTITLLGMICLWSGIMKIASESSMFDKLVKFLNPLINFLFPEMKNNRNTKKDIAMNIISNILGLGNAATPLGLKAMNEMQKENKEKNKLSDSMVMLIVLNTASLQIIPTTVIAIRSSLNSTNPTKVIFPVWISTICALIVGIVVTKICLRLEKNNK